MPQTPEPSDQDLESIDTTFRWLGGFAAGVLIGCVVWLPGLHAQNYHGFLRLFAIFGLLSAVGVITSMSGKHEWVGPLYLGGLLGAVAPVVVVLLLVTNAGLE